VTDEQLVYRRFSSGDGIIVVAALALFCAALTRSWMPTIGLAIDRVTNRTDVVRSARTNRSTSMHYGIAGSRRLMLCYAKKYEIRGSCL